MLPITTATNRANIVKIGDFKNSLERSRGIAWQPIQKTQNREPMSANNYEQVRDIQIAMIYSF